MATIKVEDLHHGIFSILRNLKAKYGSGVILQIKGNGSGIVATLTPEYNILYIFNTLAELVWEYADGAAEE